MGNSPSTQSPLTSESMNSPLISQPRSLSAHASHPHRSASTRARDPVPSAHDAENTEASAPPPYTPVAQPQEVPPPVPPRDSSPRDVRRASSTAAHATSSPRPRRRTASHSHTPRPVGHFRTPGAASMDGLAPGGGVGGFLVPPSSSPGSNYTRANSTASRPQDATFSTRTDDATLAALTSRRSSRPRPTSETPPSSGSNGGTQPQSHPAPRPPTRRNSKENPLDLLQRFDTVIIVDDSSSMEGALWIEARDALAGIADAAARYGITGIDLHFLNDRRVGTKLKSAADVKRIFDSVTPVGITPTGEKLEELLLDYLLRYEAAETTKPKPVNFLILTDGAPTDDPESVIVTAAKRLDSIHAPISQVGIQFVQLGSDPDATEALEEMDDELANKHDIRDMVDTTLYTGQQLTTELLGKILLGGINRRVDRKGYKE